MKVPCPLMPPLYYASRRISVQLVANHGAIRYISIKSSLYPHAAKLGDCLECEKTVYTQNGGMAGRSKKKNILLADFLPDKQKVFKKGVPRNGSPLPCSRHCCYWLLFTFFNLRKSKKKSLIYRETRQPQFSIDESLDLWNLYFDRNIANRIIRSRNRYMAESRVKTLRTSGVFCRFCAIADIGSDMMRHSAILPG